MGNCNELKCPNCNGELWYKFINGKEIILCNACMFWQPTTLEYYKELIGEN